MGWGGRRTEAAGPPWGDGRRQMRARVGPGKATGTRLPRRRHPAPPGYDAAFPSANPRPACKATDRAPKLHTAQPWAPTPIHPAGGPQSQNRNPAPDAPAPGTKSPTPSPLPPTWLPSSDPNRGPQHAPASGLLAGAQRPPAGQSRRQQVQSEGAADEDQQEAEQGAHLGARSRTRRAAEEPACSSRLGLRAAYACGAHSLTDRGGVRAKPRPLDQAPPLDWAPRTEPACRDSSGNLSSSSSVVRLPSFRLCIFSHVYLCLFLCLFAGSLPGAGRSRCDTRAQDTLVHPQL